VVTVAGDPYIEESPRGRRHTNVSPWAHAAFDDIPPLSRYPTLEILRSGPSYTIDTVRELLVRAEAIDLIVGADLASQLDTWHDRRGPYVNCVDVAHGAAGPGASIPSLEGWRWYEIAMQPVDLSSTFIRDMSLSDADLKKYLPAGVFLSCESPRLKSRHMAVRIFDLTEPQLNSWMSLTNRPASSTCSKPPKQR